MYIGHYEEVHLDEGGGTLECIAQGGGTGPIP